MELKPGILDAEAATVEKSLGLLGVPEVKRVSTAKVYRLEVSVGSTAEAKEVAQKAVDRLLANPVVHRVTVTVIPP